MSDTLTSTLEAETLNLGKLLNEVYRVERNQQDIVMKIIDALSQAKRDLEEELMNGFTVFNELPQVHDLLTSARKSLANGNSEPLPHLSALISSLTCRKQQLENCLFRAMVSKNIKHSNEVNIIKIIALLVIGLLSCLIAGLTIVRMWFKFKH